MDGTDLWEVVAFHPEAQVESPKGDVMRKVKEIKRCDSVLDIDTMGAQFLGRCQFKLNHKGQHKNGDCTWASETKCWNITEVNSPK